MTPALFLATAFLQLSATADPGFHFHEQPGEYLELRRGDRKVLRYMHTPRDASTKDKHELTFKPFHHLFDPVKGETLLTNGAGLAADKSLTFPHHRGLFYAFNRIKVGTEPEADTWHGRKNEYTLHEKFLIKEAGLEKATHTAELTWHGQNGKTFAIEERTVTVMQDASGTLLDFTSVLKTTEPSVKLDGDPQHAGFHIRASMQVAQKTKSQTIFTRPDGVDQPGKTRNWDPKSKKGPTNLPWSAMSVVVDDKRYTFLRITHPNNPGETRGSERDYGRFGDYFEYTLTPEKPLTVQYRVYLQAGEMTVAECKQRAEAFRGK
ncbi:MAG: DUF6807 family protein [Gemmataceae bacterium]